LAFKEPHHDSDHFIGEALRQTRTIAMIGASPSPARPSNFVMNYLQGKGYRVIPVNPLAAEQLILGEPVYARLSDVPGPVEMIDVFRSSGAVAQVVDEVISQKDRLGIQFLWLQLGVRNEETARRASAAGLAVIMERCTKIEFARLFGELSLREVNARISLSKGPEVHP
jgi:predicted CoA-binding protein